MSAVQRTMGNKVAEIERTKKVGSKQAKRAGRETLGWSYRPPRKNV